MNREAIPPRSAAWKWGITGLLLLATMINYMDRVTLANASVRVTRELRLDDSHYGHLETFFGLAFAAGSLVFGYLSDRFRVYYLYPVILAGWSLTGMATGWSDGYWQLLGCRVLLGFFEAGHWPCALKTTFALLDEKQRTMGNSILQSGASIGAIITPQIMRLMLTDQPGSWRRTFIVIGGIGLLWVAVWFLCLRSRDLDHAPAVAAPRENATGFGAILISGRFWAVALLIFGAQTVWHINRVWMMKFLQTGRGYEERAALNFNSLFYVAADAGCILAGLVAMRLIRRGVRPHDARRTVYAGACVLTSFSLLLPWLGKGWPLLGTLLLIGAGALALFPCYYTFVQELSPAHVGRLTGLLGAWVWAITSPLQSLFGMVADHTKSYDLGLVISGLAPWIGVFAMMFLWKKDRVPTAV